MGDMRHLSFSVRGKTVTDIAREKFYYNLDLAGAIELLMSCLVTDQLSEGDRMMLAIKILDGQAELVGTYPGDDYGVCELEEKNTRFDIREKLKAVVEEIDELKRERDTLLDKICCISEELTERDMLMINRKWMREGGEAPVFPDVEPKPRSSIFSPLGLSGDDPVGDFVETMIREEQGTVKKPEYGWLEPDGTFHEVDFADHMEWAWDKLKEICGGETKEFWRLAEDANAGLMSHGWVLIHNPMRGTGRVDRDETRRLTKAQREFLFDYYTERGKDDLAKKYLEDE